MNSVFIVALSYLLVLGLDGLWLGFIARAWYAEWLKHLASFDMHGSILIFWPAGFVAWFLVVFGNFLFPFRLSGLNLKKAFMNGFFFGLISYGIYDFSNYATLKTWSWQITLADIAWGGFLNALLTVFMVALQKGFWYKNVRKNK